MSAHNFTIRQLIKNATQSSLDKERAGNNTPYLSDLLSSNVHCLVDFYMDNFSIIAHNLDFDSFSKLIEFENFLKNNKEFIIHYYKISNYIQRLDNQSESDFNSPSIIHYFTSQFLLEQACFAFYIRFLVNNSIDINQHTTNELELFKMNTGLFE